MNVLECFSGTGSVGKCCEALGWGVVSVDKFMDSTHKVDIMDFDYKQYPKDYFTIVWASPPCTNYSNLQNCFIGRMRKGVIYTKEIQEKEMAEDDKLVLKALEIIDYFNPYLWFIENPAVSRMKDRTFMKDLPFYIVDYCMYSDWGYKKSTRIWTNKKDFRPLRCDGSGECGNMIGKNHKGRMGTSKTVMDNGKMIRVNTAELRKKYKDFKNINNEKNTDNNSKQIDRYRIPENLIYALFLD